MIQHLSDHIGDSLGYMIFSAIYHDHDHAINITRNSVTCQLPSSRFTGENVIDFVVIHSFGSDKSASEIERYDHGTQKPLTD